MAVAKFAKMKVVNENDEDESSLRVESNVRGLKITLDAAAIRSVYGIEEVVNPDFPHKPKDKKTNIDHVLSTLLGTPHTWGSLVHVPSGFMKPDYRVLYRMIHHCMRQSCHVTEVTKEDSYLLYAIGSGYFLDLGSFLLSEVIDCIQKLNRGYRGGLVLGSLITRVLQRAKVPLYQGESRLECRESVYTIKSWKKSLGQAKIYTRAERDEDDYFLSLKTGHYAGSNGKVIMEPKRKKQRQAEGSSGGKVSSISKRVDTLLGLLEPMEARVKRIEDNQRVFANDIAYRLCRIEEKLGIECGRCMLIFSRPDSPVEEEEEEEVKAVSRSSKSEEEKEESGEEESSEEDPEEIYVESD